MYLSHHVLFAFTIVFNIYLVSDESCLTAGKLKGQKKDSRQLVLPVATIYKGKRQQLTKRMDNYQELEDFVYGKERQVTEDNLKIAGK